MRTPTAELVRACAERVLSNRDAGRAIDPLTIEWAETLLRQNPPVRAHVSRAHADGAKPMEPQP